MKREKWHLYILQCENDKLYTGIAKDVEKRFNDHLKGRARFTRYNKPIKILYTETLRSQGDAMKRELQVKRLPKKKKLELVAG